MTLKLTTRYLSIRPRASLILLNIYYFRFNIFQKGTFKGLFEKKSILSENVEGGGGRSPLPPAPCPLPPAPLPILLRRACRPFCKVLMHKCEWLASPLALCFTFCTSPLALYFTCFCVCFVDVNQA